MSGGLKRGDEFPAMHRTASAKLSAFSKVAVTVPDQVTREKSKLAERNKQMVQA